jgi:hypothetical protein
MMLLTLLCIRSRKKRRSYFKQLKLLLKRKERSSMEQSVQMF